MISLSESSVWLCEWGDYCKLYSIYWIFLLMICSFIFGGIIFTYFYSKLQKLKNKDEKDEKIEFLGETWKA